MGLVSDPDPVMPLVAAFSRYPAALDWARNRIVEHFGPICLESEPFDFHQTDYYGPTMGSGLRKVFFTFARLTDPGNLSQTKLLANGWEAEYALSSDHPEPRPLNIDPGYLTRGKLVLASNLGSLHIHLYGIVRIAAISRNGSLSEDEEDIVGTPKFQINAGTPFSLAASLAPILRIHVPCSFET